MAESLSTPLFLAGADVISQQKCDTTPTTVPSPVQFQQKKSQSDYSLQLVWRNVILFILLHSSIIFVLFRLNQIKFYTWIHSYFFIVISALGVTVGAHRLWAHKCYKATWQLRFILMILQSSAFQNCIHEWVRDHRVHHKFVDTDADPHNSKRGFFFCHMGWLMVRKHPMVREKGKTIDMSDIESDPIVMWQKKYYVPFGLIMTFLVPTLIPYLCWNEKLSIAFIMAFFRYTLLLNGTWLVNSAAHMWGMKPYDKTLSATENLVVATLAYGEGFHNYHHSFPWDYKAAELGTYGKNWSNAFIDFFAKIGWAYDLKMATPEIIKKRIRRTGDGTHAIADDHEDEIWGWDDRDMSQEDKKLIRILHKKNDE